MRSESGLLEKFIQNCHTKQEGLSDTYITQIYSNMQELLLVQFLNEELHHQQSRVDELQKRLDAASYLLPSIKAENDLWGCDQVERQIELLEQALKGTDR
ncbi:hypothetical protein [Acinetobacter haemolyticus]|uniref:hypothetical protein n=1 Tax=Acinetobacter haemolyticus TaxID=29430 RepID=UPI003AF4EF17